MRQGLWGRRLTLGKTRAGPRAGRLAAESGSILTAATRVDATPRVCRGARPHRPWMGGCPPAQPALQSAPRRLCVRLRPCSSQRRLWAPRAGRHQPAEKQAVNGRQSQEGSSRRKTGGLSQADTSLAPSEDGPPEWQASSSNAFLNHILAINHRGDHEAPSKYDWGQSNPRAGLGEGAGLAGLPSV